MNSSYLLAAVLSITLASLFGLRPRPMLTKLIGETSLLGLIGACLVIDGTTPLPTHAVLTLNPNSAWLRALAVVWWLIGARLAAHLTVLTLGRDEWSKRARLVSDLLAGAIYVTAVLIVLNSVLDLRVNGLLATSGIIAIVLGLALQNTLADVFSGIAVGVEQPFHIGDRVSIGDHPEGVVVEINWRAIRIQTDGDDLATIPNSIVARSEIINRSVPTTRRAASVDIPTLSTARSETLLELIRQALLLCPAVLEDPSASVVIRHVGTRITTLGVNYYVATTADLSAAKSQLLRQVRRLFRHADVDGSRPETPEMLLSGLVLFEALRPEQLAILSKALMSKRYAKGDDIFRQGSQGASLYVIRAGIFEIVRDEGDERRTVHGRIGPGEYLGEMSMMSGDPRPVTASALSDAIVFELPRSAIETLLAEDEGLSAALERSIRRGLALLDRDDAARNSQTLDPAGGIFTRIQNFLQRQKA